MSTDREGPHAAVRGGDGALCQPCEGSSFLTFLPAIIIGVVVVLLLAYFTYQCVRGKDVTKDMKEAGKMGAKALIKGSADGAVDVLLLVLLPAPRAPPAGAGGCYIPPREDRSIPGFPYAWDFLEFPRNNES